MTGRRVRVDDIVGTKVIAERLGYSHPQAVSMLWRRNPDFPNPIIRLGTAYGWSWTDIEAWLERKRQPRKPR